MDDVGLFVASGHVITCDPREVIVDNLLSEHHVRVSILYCPNNISALMTNWGSPLAQTIMDGYSLKQLLVSYNESNFPTIDEEGEIVVRKKQYTFQNRKQSVGHFDHSMSRIEKLLS
jgi:monoamine oxidase